MSGPQDLLMSGEPVMIPKTVQRVADALREEVAKDARYTYFLEMSSSVYMTPYLLQHEPKIEDFLAMFEQEQIMSAPEHIEKVAKEVGLILIPANGLSRVRFVPDIFCTILQDVKIDREPAPYFVVLQERHLPNSPNSLHGYWYGFPIKFTRKMQPHKAMVRRTLPC